MISYTISARVILYFLCWWNSKEIEDDPTANRRRLPLKYVLDTRSCAIQSETCASGQMVRSVIRLRLLKCPPTTDPESSTKHIICVL